MNEPSVTCKVNVGNTLELCYPDYLDTGWTLRFNLRVLSAKRGVVEIELGRAWIDAGMTE